MESETRERKDGCGVEGEIISDFESETRKDGCGVEGESEMMSDFEGEMRQAERICEDIIISYGI